MQKYTEKKPQTNGPSPCSPVRTALQVCIYYKHKHTHTYPARTSNQVEDHAGKAEEEQSHGRSKDQSTAHCEINLQTNKHTNYHIHGVTFHHRHHHLLGTAAFRGKILSTAGGVSLNFTANHC